MTDDYLLVALREELFWSTSGSGRSSRGSRWAEGISHRSPVLRFPPSDSHLFPSLLPPWLLPVPILARYLFKFQMFESVPEATPYWNSSFGSTAKSANLFLTRHLSSSNQRSQGIHRVRQSSPPPPNINDKSMYQQSNQSCALYVRHCRVITFMGPLKGRSHIVAVTPGMRQTRTSAQAIEEAEQYRFSHVRLISYAIGCRVPSHLRRNYVRKYLRLLTQ
jgi:hypothetical protein